MRPPQWAGNNPAVSRSGKRSAGWRVRNFDGKDKIVDVVAEGVSMTVTQRQEFAAVTQSRGLEGLLQILRARAERLPASASN